ncbi:hypothetical protein HK096_001305, partial [Nowakowskiella sp. JEL0078]
MALVFLLFALVLLILLAIYVLRLKPSLKRDALLLLGIEASGKSALFNMLSRFILVQLKYGKKLQTHTSLEEAQAIISLTSFDGVPSKPIHIVDIPGHSKLRFKWSEFAPISRGIVFLIDSSTYSKMESEIAEYVYEMLINKYVAKNEVSVLFACNFQDSLLALGKEKIKLKLEAE